MTPSECAASSNFSCTLDEDKLRMKQDHQYYVSGSRADGCMSAAMGAYVSTLPALFCIFFALWNTKLAIFLNNINRTNMKCRCLIKIENMSYNLRSLENVNNEREMAFPIEYAGRQHTGENIRLCSPIVHESRHLDLHSYNDDTNKV